MFLETVEKINTINKTIALSWGGLSYTLIFGLIFLFLLVLVLVYKNKLLLASKKFNSRTALVVLLVLCWSPMFFDGIFSAGQVIFRQGKIITASTDDKLQDRLCAVDQNQNLSGGACLLIPFAKEVKNLVPTQSKIVVISSGFYGLFLQYHFIADYQASSPELADYWLLYLPTNDYRVNDKQELLEGSGASEKNWGRWQVVKIFAQGMVILKRQ